jgi:hypothetical protein
MTYILKISYYDEESDNEEYGTLEELLCSYSYFIDQISSLGRQFGDVNRISARQIINNKIKIIQELDYA